MREFTLTRHSADEVEVCDRVNRITFINALSAGLIFGELPEEGKPISVWVSSAKGDNVRRVPVQQTYEWTVQALEQQGSAGPDGLAFFKALTMTRDLPNLALLSQPRSVEGMSRIATASRTCKSPADSLQDGVPA